MSLELDLETAGVAAVTSAMVSGATTGVGLVEAYLDRIATLNPLVNAIRCLAGNAACRVHPDIVWESAIWRMDGLSERRTISRLTLLHLGATEVRR